MGDAEILDTLVEIGAKPEGRKKLTRDDLIAAMIQAVKDEKIDLEDDGEPSSPEGAEDGGDDDCKDAGESSEGTEERAAAVKEFIKDAKQRFATVAGDDSLTRGGMLDWLDEYNETDKRAKKAAAMFKGKPDRDVFDAYLEKALLYLSDEGETLANGEPYTINGEAYCCGHPCGYDEEGAAYICPVCGGEYEAEEDDEG
jgi:hypothetical protein